MAYLVTSLIVRQIIFRGVLKETKRLDPNVYHAVKKIYLRQSIPGWIVYMLSLLLVIAAWIAWEEPSLNLGPWLTFFVLLLLLFFFSVILHLVTYTKAVLEILSQRMGIEREL
jgi:tryptophan-rich sensory protein